MTFQFGSWAERIWIVEVLIFLLSSLRALIHFPPVIGRARLLPSTDFPFQSVVLYINSPLRFFFLFLLLFSPQHFRWCELLRWRRERERANVRNGGDWSISQLPSSPFLLVCCCLSVEWDWRPRSQTEEEEEEEKKKKKLCERVGPKKTSVDCLIPRSSPSSTFLLPIDFTTTPSVWYSLAAVYNFDVLPPFRMRPTGLLLLLLQRLLLLLRRLARPAVLLPH